MKEDTGKNKIFIVIIICLCAVIIAGLIYFMKLKGGSDSAFKPDLDSNAKTQTADDTGEKPTGIRKETHVTLHLKSYLTTQMRRFTHRRWWSRKKEDWKKAAAGEYADTVTFTISYVDKSE